MIARPTMNAILTALLGAASLALPAAAAAQDQAPIAQDYEPDPAIWLLEDEDTRIYLFGTVHALPEGFRWRSTRLDAIVAEADALIVESSDEDMGAEDPWLAGLLGSLAKRPRVSERLSPENGWKWLALGESLGMPPDSFDRLPPLLAMFGIGVSLGRQETGSDSEYGVETVLEADFEAAGKPIGSIENGADVMMALLGMNEAVLIKELDRELSLWDGEDPGTMFSAVPPKGGAIVAEAMLAQEHAWAQGEEIDIRNELFGATGFSRSMGKLLLDNRNRAWAAWLENRLAAPGTLLVAVGAAHLAGHNSVQVMLARRGLASERLN